jgi:hypothetical protein
VYEEIEECVPSEKRDNKYVRESYSQVFLLGWGELQRRTHARRLEALECTDMAVAVVIDQFVTRKVLAELVSASADSGDSVGGNPNDVRDDSPCCTGEARE